MGEPADDEAFRRLHDNVVTELPTRNAAVVRARQDENAFRSIMVDNSFATREAIEKLNKNLITLTKVMALLARNLESGESDKADTTPHQVEVTPDPQAA